jgi:hypothetical protein
MMVWKRFVEVDVVGVRARPAAERLEVEPHQAAGALAIGNRAALDVERLLLSSTSFSSSKILGMRSVRQVVDLHLLHLQTA